MTCNIPIAINLMISTILTLSLVTVSNASAEYKDCANVWVCLVTTGNDEMRAGNVTDGNEGNDRIVAGRGMHMGVHGRVTPYVEVQEMIQLLEMTIDK